MTYAQRRATLARIAASDTPAPGLVHTAAIGTARLRSLRGCGFVRYVGEDRWALTRLGYVMLAQRRMPKARPTRPQRTKRRAA